MFDRRRFVFKGLIMCCHKINTYKIKNEQRIQVPPQLKLSRSATLTPRPVNDRTGWLIGNSRTRQIIRWLCEAAELLETRRPTGERVVTETCPDQNERGIRGPEIRTFGPLAASFEAVRSVLEVHYCMLQPKHEVATTVHP
jgi:hypothetical protein